MGPIYYAPPQYLIMGHGSTRNSPELPCLFVFRRFSVVRMHYLATSYIPGKGI